MAWRREVEALVGPPAGAPAIVVTLDAGQVRCRIVPAGSVRRMVQDLAGEPQSTGAEPPAGSGGTRRAAPAALPFPDASIDRVAVGFAFFPLVAVWSFRDRLPPPVRRALLAELVRVLVPAGTLVVVDHNRPRRRLAAIAAVAMSPRPPGATPAAAWRRLAYPVAREAHAAGFVLHRPRLAAGERVQIISAWRAGA
jgi:SAM-dependent methyltransferase